MTIRVKGYRDLRMNLDTTRKISLLPWTKLEPAASAATFTSPGREPGEGKETPRVPFRGRHK